MDHPHKSEATKSSEEFLFSKNKIYSQGIDKVKFHDNLYIQRHYKVEYNAGVAKLGQRRKIEGLILSGSGVQIAPPAPSHHTTNPSLIQRAVHGLVGRF